MSYKRTIIRVSIHRDEINPAQGSSLTVCDSGGGPYLILEQNGKSMAFDAEELVLLASTGLELLAQQSLSSDER